MNDFIVLIDPNDDEHYIGNPDCPCLQWSGLPINCSCGGLNHYWFVDSENDSDLLAYECDKCGGNEHLSPESCEHA